MAIAQFEAVAAKGMFFSVRRQKKSSMMQLPGSSLSQKERFEGKSKILMNKSD